MTEENKISYAESENNVAVVWMIFSIVWLILTISVIFSWLWIPLLIIWFILWIIWLFWKPRWKAWVAIIIPLIVFTIIAACVNYIWKSVKAPANDFKNRATEQIESIDEESFDEDKFETIVNDEFNQIIESLTEEELNQLYETSNWNNGLEKRSYVFFNILQQGMDNAITTYKNELPSDEIVNPEQIENEEDINTEDEITNIENITNEEDTIIEEDMDKEPISETQETNEENNTLNNNEVFTNSEQSEIEEIINILE